MKKESLLTRIRWWLEDLADAPVLARLRWQLEDFREAHDGRVLLGALILLAVLVAGGFATARAVAGGSHAAATRTTAVREVTVRQKVRVRVHGHDVTRWRTHKVYAKAQTVMQTQTIHTRNGTRVVTHPVTRYHVIYRKRLVRVHGKTRTVLQPVTNTKTLTNTRTQLVTNTKTQLATVTSQLTESQTVTLPVTSVVTTTVVSTETETLPITVTVTLPTG